MTFEEEERRETTIKKLRRTNNFPNKSGVLMLFLLIGKFSDRQTTMTFSMTASEAWKDSPKEVCLKYCNGARKATQPTSAGHITMGHSPAVRPSPWTGRKKGTQLWRRTGGGGLQ